MQSPVSLVTPDSSQQSLQATVPKLKLLDQVRLALRLRHYSKGTEKAYVDWIKRLILFHGNRHPVEMGEHEINSMLTDIAVHKNVSACTQNQALGTLLFLYQHVLDRFLGWVNPAVQAKKPKRLPVVLNPEEARTILEVMDGAPWLVATLRYDAGLRFSECYGFDSRIHGRPNRTLGSRPEED